MNSSTNDITQKPLNLDNNEDMLSPSKLKGRAKAEFNQNSYKKYVDELEANQRRFPTGPNGEVNYSAVATACGFNRQVLYKTLASQFNRDVKRIGTEVHERYGSQGPERLASIAEKNKKTASKLQSDLEVKTREVEGLKDIIAELTKELDALKASQQESEILLEEMIGSGRSFKL